MALFRLLNSILFHLDGFLGWISGEESSVTANWEVSFRLVLGIKIDTDRQDLGWRALGPSRPPPPS